jgi:hypothetical protein
MGLLLRHPDERKRVENGFAFNFQLPGEIVDSNLAHPAFLVPRAVLRSSSQPHGVSVLHSHAIEDVCACHLFSCFGSGAIFRLMLFVFVFVRGSFGFRRRRRRFMRRLFVFRGNFAGRDFHGSFRR